ncbi:MAG TPA: ABC transporter substrate-binding protein, partial [Mycobacteriales bacterium]|nr:ABC transporter substrate-binding protein [Mycobacteriales bacterium]
MAATLGLLAGCARTGGGTFSSPAGIRIGVMLPLTGVDAEPAREELNGIELAADAVNHGGGIRGRPIQLVIRDVN